MLTKPKVLMSLLVETSILRSEALMGFTTRSRSPCDQEFSGGFVSRLDSNNANRSQSNALLETLILWSSCSRWKRISNSGEIIRWNLFSAVCQ